VVKWFEVFKDEKLQDLVRRALQRNYDLRDAVARVEEARASLGITRSNQYPNSGAGASVEINRLSRGGSTPIPRELLPSQNRNFGSAALELLSFEIGQAATRDRGGAGPSSERGGEPQSRSDYVGQRRHHVLPDTARARLHARHLQAHACRHARSCWR